VRWSRFLRFQRAQDRGDYHAISARSVLVDGDWDYSAEQWKAKETRELIAKWLPRSIVNSRIQWIRRL